MYVLGRRCCTGGSGLPYLNWRSAEVARCNTENERGFKEAGSFGGEWVRALRPALKKG